jgi:uncharacterized iron-regulated protein
MARALALVALLAGVLAWPLRAEVTPPAGMDIYVLGEVHDNAAHHATQARLVGEIAPGAVVWEMLDPAQVAALAGVDRADGAAMAAALDWAQSGWPDFAMYHPIFVAAGDAVHLGAAAPRDALRAAMEGGLGAAIGQDQATAWGLGPLSPADQAAREAEQAEAHCQALPAELLPGMVQAQRLRDWSLASRAVAAVEAGQGPVVVITGSGHARKDQGVPALIASARPGLNVWSLGQVEVPEGSTPDPGLPYDAVIATPPVPRGDPCDSLTGG